MMSSVTFLLKAVINSYRRNDCNEDATEMQNAKCFSTLHEDNYRVHVGR